MEFLEEDSRNSENETRKNFCDQVIVYAIFLLTPGQVAIRCICPTLHENGVLISWRVGHGWKCQEAEWMASGQWKFIRRFS
jgi:hypothetical protein